MLVVFFPFFFCFFFFDWIGKLGAFIVCTLAHALYFIDELGVNFTMCLEKVSAVLLRSTPLCFQCRLPNSAYCHCTFKSYQNSHFSQLLHCLTRNEQCHYFKQTYLPLLKHRDWGQTERKTGRIRGWFFPLHPRGPSALNVKVQSAGETDSRRRCEWDDWRSALIDSSSSLALPWGWLTMWFISHFVTELIQ